MRTVAEILRDDLRAVTPMEIQIAENERRRTGERIEEALCRLGFLKEETVAEALGIQYNLPVLASVSPEEVDLDWLYEHASIEKATSSVFLPLKSNGARAFAIVNPADLAVIDLIRSFDGRARDLKITTVKTIREALERITVSESPIDLERLIERGEIEGTEGNAVETLVDAILYEAIKKKATDVHIEPTPETTHIYLRVDGVRRPLLSLPPKLHQAVVNIIKVRADIKPDQHFTPDDKKFTFGFMGRVVDIRVSLLPSAWGPAILNRILDKMSSLITLEDLGYSRVQYDTICRLARSPNGLMLVTGPTGSGKSTTLYALLSKLASPEKKLITVEDPIEYTIPRITQCQAREDRGFTFDRALRSILRHDPDIIMVGEIRDRDTARIAMEASLTGHLVLSTLHTNSAVDSVIRLMDMGVQTVYIASTLRAVIAQRLIRKICGECKRETRLPDEIVEKYGLGLVRGWEGRGCKACGMTGYSGRTVVAEALIVDHEIAEMIHEKQPGALIRKTAIEKGFMPIERDALQKVTAGITDLKEIENVIGAV